jgi:hypothetical protein
MKALALVLLLSLSVCPAQSREMLQRLQAAPNMSPRTEKLETAQAFSGICRTWNGIMCFVNPPGPVGAPCWCNTQAGPVQGVITFQ